MTATNWKNVNNWHWVEKNCLAWTQDYLKERIAPLQVDGDGGLRVVAKNLASAEGDIYVNVRKGKTIYIFDMEITIDWEGMASLPGCCLMNQVNWATLKLPVKSSLPTSRTMMLLRIIR